MSKEEHPTQENENVTQPSQKNGNPDQPFWKNASVQAAFITGGLGFLGGILTALIAVFGPAIIKSRTERLPEQSTAVATPTPTPADSATASTDGRDNDKDNTVIMIGSGTVYKYLTEHQLAKEHQFVKEFGENKSLYVPILEGPTGVGAKLFASAFENENMPILVMAASRLNIDELQQQAPRTGGGPPVSKPESVFEVYLGADPLQLFLIAGSEDYAGCPLQLAFEDIYKASSGAVALDYRKICGLRGWRGNHYNFYAGSLDSGTTGRWLEILNSPDRCDAWPSKPNLWDVQTPDAVKSQTEPRIYLGSKVLNRDLQQYLQGHIERADIPIVCEGKSVVRGLYLYGYIDRSEKNMVVIKQTGEKRYKLPRGVTEILRLLFEKLDAAWKNEKFPLNILDRDCIKEQRTYFNLNAAVGSVSVSPPKRGSYRPDLCTDRPVEKRRAEQIGATATAPACPVF